MDLRPSGLGRSHSGHIDLAAGVSEEEAIELAIALSLSELATSGAPPSTPSGRGALPATSALPTRMASSDTPETKSSLPARASVAGASASSRDLLASFDHAASATHARSQPDRAIKVSGKLCRYVLVLFALSLSEGALDVKGDIDGGNVEGAVHQPIDAKELRMGSRSGDYVRANAKDGRYTYTNADGGRRYYYEDSEGVKTRVTKVRHSTPMACNTPTHI
jgi:hypothetical protein